MNNVTRWNPVRDMLTLRETMDRMFDEAYRTRGANTTTWSLPIDAYVTNDAIVLEVTVPGVKPEAVEVMLEGDTLTIRGEFKPAVEEAKYLLRERAAGRFERTLTINTPIDHEKVAANFENGVLTLTLPKAEAVKPRQIQIQPKVSAN